MIVGKLRSHPTNPLGLPQFSFSSTTSQKTPSDCRLHLQGCVSGFVSTVPQDEGPLQLLLGETGLKKGRGWHMPVGFSSEILLEKCHGIPGFL